MAIALFAPRFQAVNANGLPVSGAKISFYRAGTSSRMTVYQDYAGLTPHTNPVVADASGTFPAIYVQNTTFLKYILTDANDVTIATVDRFLIAAGSSANGNLYTVEKASDLPSPATEFDEGHVLNDPDPTNNGYYYRDAGAWVKGRGFPDTFAQVTLSGTGAAQTGTTGAGVNPADIEVFFAVVVTENTGPLTLSIDGEAPRPVVNLAGAPLSSGEWTGVAMFFLNDAGQYQLMLDAGAAASAAQSASDAGVAKDAAELARDQAQASAAILNDAHWQGDWSASVTYKLYDSVLFKGSSWRSRQDENLNHSPPSLPTTVDAWWQLVARRGEDGAGTVAELVQGPGILIDATDPTRPVISTDQTADETQNFYATLALEQAEDRSDGPVMAGPDGNGLFDGFNALTYVDTAAASGLDTSEAGLLKPLPLATAMSISFTNDSAGYAGYNLRFRIPASKLSGKGDQIKLGLAGVTTGAALVLSSAYVGHKASSGNVWDFDGGQKQLKVGGNTGFTVPVNGNVETDWLDFDFDDSRDLIVAIYCTSGDVRVGAVASSIGGSFSSKAGSDETAVSAPSGYSTSGAYDRIVCNRVFTRTSAMSVRSAALTLSAAPDWARLYFIADLQDAALNTDLRVSVSRDGDDYTALTASHMYQRPDGSGVFASDKASLTSGSGSLGRWLIETDNATQPKVLAMGVMFGVN